MQILLRKTSLDARSLFALCHPLPLFDEEKEMVLSNRIFYRQELLPGAMFVQIQGKGVSIITSLSIAC